MEQPVKHKPGTALLEKISDRIALLDKPAYVKNGALVYVAANKAYGKLFGVESTELIGRTTSEMVNTVERVDLEDRERRCVVFGQEQIAAYSDPFGAGRFQVEIERFATEDGANCIFGVFEPVSGILTLPVDAAQQSTPEAASKSDVVMAKNPEPAIVDGLGKEILEEIFGAIDAAVVVYDDQDRLVYGNTKSQELYPDLIGKVQPGMTIRQILELVHDFGQYQVPGGDAESREAWVDSRLAAYHKDNSGFLEKTRDGRWIKGINRKIEHGQTISIRMDVSDFKAREQLLETKIHEIELYRTLLDALPVATFVRDSTHRIFFANKTYADLCGIELGSLVGTDETDIFGLDGIRLRMANEKAFADGKGIDEEQDLQTPTGDIIQVLTQASRVITENGDTYLVGSMTDITAMRTRESELRTANFKAEDINRDFQNIIASMDVGLVVLDANLRVELVNDALKHIWQDGDDAWAGDIVGTAYRDILENNCRLGRYRIDADAIEAFCDEKIAAIRAGQIPPQELVVNDGTTIVFSAMPLSRGRHLLCFVDITRLRRLDQEVAVAHDEVERVYRLAEDATNTMPQGLIVIDDDKIVLANETLPMVLGFDLSLVTVGQSWEALYRESCIRSDISDEKEVDALTERFRAALKNGTPLDYNFPLDGNRWLRLQSRRNRNGQTVLLLTDLTEIIQREYQLKALVERAEAADRAKSEFLANMSHEIRTPMNGILGMAELLARTPLDTRQKTFVDIVTKSGTALLTIINDILDFSNLSSGQMHLRQSAFDPGEAAEDVASLMQARAAEKNIELIVRRQADMADRIMGDAGRFRQIITNLVSNAVKFTERGHVVVEIGTHLDEAGAQFVDLIVQDTGVGIAPGKLDRVFDMFAKVDGAASRRPEGTGLGLAITEGLVRMFGGTIDVASQIGQGSTFSVSLPTRFIETKAKPRSVPVNIENARILVVDDNEISRTTLVEQLSEWAFDAVAVENGQAALDLLTAAAESGVYVDAIILDQDMPDEKGLDVARRIRADKRFADLPIIFLTSMDIGDDERDFREINVAAHLMKPARSDMLRETLVDVLRAARTAKGYQFGFRAPPLAPDLLPRRNAIPVAHGGHPSDSAEPDGEDDDFEDEDFDRVFGGFQQLLESQPMLEEIGRPTGLDVLIAEDNEVNQIVYRQILDGSGINFHIVANGEEAIDAWQGENPAVILMDISMPIMDGLTATRKIREMERDTGVRVPIVGVTTHALESNREMCLEAGMDDHLCKPISPERLENKIRHWITSKTASLAGV